MKTYSITDYGARSDASVCTEAIQRTVDACRDGGGGRVLVEGGCFVTGTIRLYSNIELHIAAGATLKASPDLSDYPDTDYGFFNVKACPRGSARCLIFIGQCENVSVTGLGTIDCSAEAFIEPFTDDNGVSRYRRTSTESPGRMIFAMSCKNLNFADFLMREMAAGWGMWINDCSYVTVSRIKMECDPLYPNADGVHINCSSDVTVSDCVLHTGDDCVIIRSNCNTLKTPRPCERVSVKGCVMSSGCQAVRIGWRNDYEIKNCVLSDLVITDSNRGIVIELPDHSSPFDVGAYPTKIHDIRFNNIVMNDVAGRPIFVKVYPENLYGGFDGIHFSNVTVKSGMMPTVAGRPDAVIKNVTFDNCDFTVDEITDKTYIICKNTTGLRINNTVINVTREQKNSAC